MDAKKIVEKIFSQAERGEVLIGEDNPWCFYAKFAMKKEGKAPENFDCPIFDIPDFDLFVEKVSTYLEKAKSFYAYDKEYFEITEEEFEEKLFFDLMVNTSYSDQKDIYSAIDRREKMLKELPCGEKYIGEYLDKRVYCKTVKNHSNIESPYKMTISFKSEEGEFSLPALNFGIVDDQVYLFAVQNKREKQTSTLAKKMDRYLRKLNAGVDMEDIVSSVSPSAVASLAIFSSICEKNNINEIVAPSFLPIRYNATFFARDRLSEEIKNEGLEQLDRDQFNITNRFSYLFLRHNFHFPSSIADFDEDRGAMKMQLDGKDRNGENIIFSLYDLPKGKVFDEPLQKQENTRWENLTKRVKIW